MLRQPLRLVALAAVGISVLTAPSGCKRKEDPTITEVAGSQAKLVEVRPKKSEGELAGLLAKHAKAAHARGLAPYAVLGATWCKPCVALEKSMDDERMKAAFEGTYIVHLDIDEWGSQLDKVSLAVAQVPTVIALDAEGKGTSRSIHGGAWGNDVPANMAPALAKFFHQAE